MAEIEGRLERMPVTNGYDVVIAHHIGPIVSYWTGASGADVDIARMYLSTVHPKDAWVVQQRYAMPIGDESDIVRPFAESVHRGEQYDNLGKAHFAALEYAAKVSRFMRRYDEEIAAELERTPDVWDVE